MEALPLDICKIIDQYKVSMELLEARPKQHHYVCKFLAEERDMITQICALSFGNLATILRARDILEASVDLIDFYRESESNWNAQHDVWGLMACDSPPACREQIGYLVYQWSCLQGENASLDGIAASCLLGKFVFW